jgi:hypothetical protein
MGSSSTLLAIERRCTIFPKDEVVVDNKKEGSIMRGRREKRSTTTA